MLGLENSTLGMGYYWNLPSPILKTTCGDFSKELINPISVEATGAKIPTPPRPSPLQPPSCHCMMVFEECESVCVYTIYQYIPILSNSFSD